MGDPACPPLPRALAPDVEALLDHERTIDADMGVVDIVRARALARARQTMRHTVLQPAPRAWLLGLPRPPLGLAIGAVVAAGVATALELFVFAGAQVSMASGDVHVVSSVDLANPAPESGQDTQDSQDIAGAPIAVQPIAVQRAPGGPSLRATADEGLDELRLLERARLYDRRREYDSVLTSTREHQRRFAKGRLSEERDVLQIKALIGLHRAHEARQTAALFRREFPRSVLLGSIDRLLASLP